MTTQDTHYQNHTQDKITSKTRTRVGKDGRIWILSAPNSKKPYRVYKPGENIADSTKYKAATIEEANQEFDEYVHIEPPTDLNDEWRAVVNPSQDKPETTASGIESDKMRIALEAELHRAERETNEQARQQFDESQKEPDSPPTDSPLIPAFPVSVFPDILQRVIQENARHQLYKADWLGSAILYAASAAVGNAYGARWKTYAQKSTLYLAIVGMPGTNKSGPFDYALKPLHDSDATAYRLYKEQLNEYERWASLNKKKRDLEGLPEIMEPPVYRTILVSDVTPEALVETHQKNPIGLGLFMDELAGWFNNFNRYSKGSEQQNWLSNWSFGPFKSLRLGRGATVVMHPLISVAGTIQPGVLSELTKDLRSHNGFIDRILFAYPDDQKKSHDSDSQLDPGITDSYHQCINRLLDLRNRVRTDEYGEFTTEWIPFAPDAFTAMRLWRDRNTDRANLTENNAHKGIYAKLDAYIIRFCLLLELLDYACGESDLSAIRLTTVERAATLTAYFHQNAMKVQYELTEQTPDERLPTNQQRLLKALPDLFVTADAVNAGANLTPPVSESSVKRLLRNTTLFKKTAYGEYVKL